MLASVELCLNDCPSLFISSSLSVLFRAATCIVGLHARDTSALASAFVDGLAGGRVPLVSEAVKVCLVGNKIEAHVCLRMPLWCSVFGARRGVGASWQEIREVLSGTLAVDAASGLDSEAHPCPCHLLQLQLRPPPSTRCQHHEMSEHTTRKTPLIVA